MDHPFWRLVKVVLWIFAIFALICVVFARCYQIAIGTDCSIDKLCDELPEKRADFENGLYYAAQTVTTTGYGSGIVLKTKAIQRLSIVVMPVTALLWGVLIGVVYDAWKKAVDFRRAATPAQAAGN